MNNRDIYYLARTKQDNWTLLFSLFFGAFVLGLRLLSCDESPAFFIVLIGLGAIGTVITLFRIYRLERQARRLLPRKSWPARV